MTDSNVSTSDAESAAGPNKKSGKSIWFHLHLWIGWITAIPLFLVCLSGGVLAFEKELRHWEYPERFNLTPSGEAMSIDDVMDIYRSATPRIVVRHLGLPSSEKEAYGAYVGFLDEEGKNAGGGFVIVNPYTGELTRQADKFTISGLMTDLHRRLAMGAVGRQIVAISSIILAVTCIFGLILWWPLRGRTFQRAIRRGRALDWHNALGLVTMGPLIIMALTGALLTYAGDVFPWLEKTFQSEPARPADPVVEVVEGQSKIPLSLPLATVRENFPDGQVTGVQPGGSAKNPYVFFVTSDGFNYRVCMNPYTGEEMSRFDGKANGPIGKFQQSYFKFHTLHFNTVAGTIWGLLSALGAVLIATGVWITMAKWRRKARRARA